MCGRYALTDDRDIAEIEKILHELNMKFGYSDGQYKTGEIFPTNNVPVIMAEGSGQSLRIMRWGFPQWNGKGVIINARSESAAEKRMFSKALAEKRCVVISTGFYEWQRKGSTKEKTKYLFHSVDSPMLYMAGIYNTFALDDRATDCFAILTRDANKYISDVHDRMPVILYRDEISAWLMGQAFIPEAFARENVMLERLPA